MSTGRVHPWYVSNKQLETVLNYEELFRQAYEYVANFVAKSHPDRGRSGAVCPFLPKTLMKDGVWFTVARTPQPSHEQLTEIIKESIDAFLNLEPRTGVYKTVIVLLPDMLGQEGTRIIDEVHIQLKRQLLKEGLMLGEFYKTHTGEGIYNPAFHPLQSPVPMLAIRRLVQEDLVFLIRDEDPAKHRIDFLQGYLRAFDGNLSAHRRALALTELHRAYADMPPAAINYMR